MGRQRGARGAEVAPTKIVGMIARPGSRAAKSKPHRRAAGHKPMSKEQVEFYQKAAAEGKQVLGRGAAKASAQALAGDSSGGARGGVAGASGRPGKPKGKKGGAKGVDYTAMVVSEAEAQLAQRLANGRGGRGYIAMKGKNSKSDASLASLDLADEDTVRELLGRLPVGHVNERARLKTALEKNFARWWQLLQSEHLGCGEVEGSRGMEALGRLIRNVAGAFVRHTPRRESPPPSDSGSGSDGDPSTPDDSSGDDDDSARGDDPPNGVVPALQTLRISLYNPLFHSGSDGRPIKGALRNPGGVKVEETASTREPSGGAAGPHRRSSLLCVYGRRTGGGFMGSGPSTSPMYAFPRVGTHDARPIEPSDADLAAELRRIASPPLTPELLRDRERGLAHTRRRRRSDENAPTNAPTNAPMKTETLYPNPKPWVANAAVGSKYVPCVHPKLVDALGSRAYCGRFSRSGNVFAVACQDRRIHVYDTSNDAWGVRGVVNARALRWTVTDCAVSPVDESILFYASITPYVHLARVPDSSTPDSPGGGSNAGRRTTSGGTQTPHSDSTPHQSLEIGRGFASPGLERDGVFGVWSCRWSSDGTTLLCGTSDAAACVHDVERDVTVVRHKAHDGDVNAVAWANGGDGGDTNVYFTGSDDCVVKAWDTRAAPRCGPVGVFLGHTEGVTHVDSRDDGRHLLSNGKDQTVRVWDSRRAWSNEDAAAWCRRRPIPVWSWDYRFMAYPASGWDFDMARFEGTAEEKTTFRAKRALQTLRGHRVDQTLIRAYFSPRSTTGGRYVYSGSGDGAVCFWDLQTGELVAKTSSGDGSGLFSAAPHSVIGPALRRTRRGEYPANEAALRRGALVRDCAWHPFKPRLVSVAWDGAVVQWDADVNEDAGVDTAGGCDSSYGEDHAVTAGSDAVDEGG